MESRLGQDFSEVRVHSDGPAGKSALSVDAIAYTVGSHIVFAPAQYAPGTPTGQQTLAHELAHVVQQAAGPVEGTQRPDGIIVSHPTDRFEREADRIAGQIQSGRTTSAAFRPPVAGGRLARAAPRTASMQTTIQRAFSGKFPDATKALCYPNQAADTSQITRFVESTEWRADVYLPQVDITTQDDLRSYLVIWKGWGECVYGALNSAKPGVIPSNYRQRFDRAYASAVKTLFVRAEQGTGTPSAQLAVAANLDLLLPAVRPNIEAYIKLDKAERLALGANPEIVLKMLNPGDWMGNYCSQNCPAAAEAVQDYLQTGKIRPDDCTPIKEAHRSGYTVSDDHWSAQVASWAVAWPLVQGGAKTHGQFVMVEGDRVTPPADLTQWHYFIVLNIKGKLVAVDGYLRIVRDDIPAYVQGLGTRRYRVSNGRVDVNPVRTP